MMRLPKIDHVAPSSVAEACAILEKNGDSAVLLAGGTDLLVACKLRNVKASLLVSLKKVRELREIKFDGRSGLSVGAMATLADVKQHTAIQQQYPALAQAAGLVGATQLQYMGTLGGNICLNTRCIYYNQSHTWRKSRAVCLKMGGDVCHVVHKGGTCYAVFSADTAPALIALNAAVRLVGASGERTIPLAQLYSGDGKAPIALRQGEILTEIMLPPPAENETSLYVKYRVRRAIDFPLAGVAVRMARGRRGTCEDCTVVVNAVASAPLVVQEVGDVLRGKEITPDLLAQAAEKAQAAARPVANVVGASPAYRRKMIGPLTKRALVSASQTRIRP